MERAMAWLEAGWRLAGYPVTWVLRAFGLPPLVDPLFIAAKVVVVLLVAGFVLSLVRALFRLVTGRDSGRLVDPEEVAALRRAGAENAGTLTRPLAAWSAPTATIPQLKRARDYHGLGHAYASVNRFAKAATWFDKAGDDVAAAECIALAGKPARAARRFEEAGEPARAGMLYSELGRHAHAARAFEKAGHLAAAANSHAQARQYGPALECWRRLFEQGASSGDDLETAAKRCREVLARRRARKRATPETLEALEARLGRR
jgi:tetratricopeptide (TPR) repeat protein